MTPRTRIRIAITATMAAFTLGGSAANLWHIADKADMVAYLGPLSVVAALDGLAIVAALTVHDDRSNGWAWCALVAGTAGSAGLQYAVAEQLPGDFLVEVGQLATVSLYRALHCLPTVATLVTCHLTIMGLPDTARTAVATGGVSGRVPP